MIEWYAINFVRWLFNNHDLNDDLFVNAGYDLEPTLSEITGEAYLFEDIRVKPLRQLREDLDGYLYSHNLSQQQKEKISELCSNDIDKEEATRILSMLN